MRFPYLMVGVAISGVLACATGEEVPGKSTAPLLDAGLINTPIDQSGGAAGSEPMGSGGMMTMGSGGTMPVGMGGMMPAAGGSAAGGKASGGSGSGGRSTGGMAGASTGGKGGAAGSGAGGKATGGAMSSGGADPGDGGNCPAGQKFCGGLCTPPAPRVGCDLNGCNPCTTTAPMNGYVTCANNQCAWDCLSGYTKNADKCEGMGTGGNTGNCKPSSCPPCNVISGPACCTAAGKCGCPAIPYVPPTCATPP